MPLPQPNPDARVPAALAHPRRSLLAVWSLLLGLGGFFTLFLLFVGLIPAVLGLICGHLALIRIQHSQGRLRGKGIALTGLIAGYLTVLLTPVIAISMVVLYPHAVEYVKQGQESVRLDHASELYRACENYARDHQGRYPGKWDDLRGRYLSPNDLKRLLSSQHNGVWAFIRGKTGDDEEGANPAFQLVPHERPILRELEGSVVVLREIAPADVERIAVVYDNGETAMSANPDRE